MNNFCNIIDNIAFSYIKKSQIHGFGLFAEKDIAPQTLMGTLDGQKMSWNLYQILFRQCGDLHIGGSPAFFEWNALDRDTLLVRAFRTKYSFINHSREPNLYINQREWKVYSKRAIEKNEELLLDYREETLNEDYIKGHGSTFL